MPHLRSPNFWFSGCTAILAERLRTPSPRCFRSAASTASGSTSESGDGQDRANPCGVQLDVTRASSRCCLEFQAVLAVDPTMQGDQTTSIVISAVYRSCAIPLAWSIMPANTPGPIMLRVLSEAVPEDMTVLVMCDRGLRSPKLWDQIRSVGWHPYMRQSINTVFCPDGPARAVSRTWTRRICWGRDSLQRRANTVVWDLSPISRRNRRGGRGFWAGKSVS